MHARVTLKIGWGWTVTRLLHVPSPTPINFKSNSRYFHFCQKKEASNLRYSHEKSQRKWKKREIKKDTNPNVNSKIQFNNIREKITLV